MNLCVLIAVSPCLALFSLFITLHSWTCSRRQRGGEGEMIPEGEQGAVYWGWINFKSARSPPCNCAVGDKALCARGSIASCHSVQCKIHHISVFNWLLGAVIWGCCRCLDRPSFFTIPANTVVCIQMAIASDLGPSTYSQLQSKTSAKFKSKLTHSNWFIARLVCAHTEPLHPLPLHSCGKESPSQNVKQWLWRWNRSSKPSPLPPCKLTPPTSLPLTPPAPSPPPFSSPPLCLATWNIWIWNRGCAGIWRKRNR